MELSKNALTVLERRYLIKNGEGVVIETVEELFRRVAGAIAASDRRYDENADCEALADSFYRMMTNLEFLPNSPTLMNAGRPLGQLSACFVLPVEDTMEGIFETIKQAALIHKSGGGTGFSFSRLRPCGSAVNSTGGVASGPISFMKVFNMATEAVKQGGTRRGANMGILRVDHPDIMEFIHCKTNNKEITNFNISVGLTEKFMNAVEAGKDYELVDPHGGRVTGTLNAREVFECIVDAAWHNGEPGIIFLDRLNRDNVVPKAGEIESTNPCGEQPLLPYESCNLGSINLTKMLREENGVYSFDWDKLKATAKKAVHFLDNVIDANKYPLKEIDFMTKQTRKVGLGVMGWADALLRLKIPYNSEQAVRLAETVMRAVTEAGREESRELAKARGTFPLFQESTLDQELPQRNGTEMIEVNPILREVLEERGLYSDELMKKIAKQGSLEGIEEIPEEIRRVFVSAHEVSPEFHIRMQAAFQRHTDNAVSKTVNFCNSATREEVAEVYKLAFRLGCKGVTIYRDGSRSEQVLNIGKVKKDGQEESPAEGGQAVIKPRPRPDMTTGITERVKIGCGNLYITVNYDDKGICEIFTNTGKAGGCPSQSEATARLASIALRSGIDVRSIIDQLKGIRCPSTIRQSGMKCTSCPDAIAKAIERVYQQQVRLGHWAEPELSAAEGPAASQAETVVPGRMRFCPECGAKLEHEGGCVICRNCGYSKCG